MTAQNTGEQSWPHPTYAWYVVGIICFGYVFAFIDRIIVGLLTPAIQADLGISDSEAGLLQGMAFALFYTLFGVPLGWLADRWSRKTLLTIGMTVWSVMTAVCGMANSFWLLFLARIGVGIGEATLNPCASSMIGDYFPPKTRPKAFGVYVMAVPVATAVTYLGIGLLLQVLQGYQTIDVPLLGAMKPWQVMFLIVGLPGLIPALFFMLTVKEPLRRDYGAKHKGNATAAETKAFLAANFRTFFALFGGVSMIYLSIYGYLNWMPTYFSRVFGWTIAEFSIAFGVFGGVAGIISAMSAGWIANALKARGYVDGTVRACLFGCVGAAVGATIAPLMPTSELALGMYVFAMLFSNFPAVLSLSAIAEATPNEMRALVTSLYVLVIGLLSSGLGPYSVGFVTDHVFGDRMMIGHSLAVVAGVTGVIGIILLAWGLSAYRGSLTRATWAKA